MSEMNETDRKLAQELLAAWDGSSAHRPAIEQAVNSMSEDAVAMTQTARRLVTAELAARALPDEDALVAAAKQAAADPLTDKARKWDAVVAATRALDAIRPHIAALQARAEAAEAENARLRDLLRRWCSVPEITEIEAEDREPETDQIWRETRAALGDKS